MSKKLFEKNGRKFTGNASKESLEFAVNYKPTNDDILLVTYPKAGRSWAYQMMIMIANNGVFESIGPVSWIEVKGVDTVLKPIIVSHLPYDLLPKNPLAKYLYVFRNPKDTVVSLYYHLKEHQYFDEDMDFKKFFCQWIKGQYFEYFADVSDYWRHRLDGKSDYVVYEQMKLNPKEGVLKIANFLGKEFVDKLLANNELLLNEVLNKTSFDYMKINNRSEKQHHRKGIVGDWRSHLTRDESDLIDTKFTEYFTGTELELIWREDMKWL